MREGSQRAFRRQMAAVKMNGRKRRGIFSRSSCHSRSYDSPTRLKEQPKHCSCDHCRNPRRVPGRKHVQLTLAERRSLIALAEAWNFYDSFLEEDLGDESEYLDPCWDDDYDYDQTRVKVEEDYLGLIDYDDLDDGFGDLHY